MSSALSHLQLHTISLQAGREHIAELVGRHDCGWSDGGCYTFAQGVSRALGERASLAYIGRETGRQDHAVVYIKDLDIYLDAMGAHTRQGLFERMSELEIVKMKGIWAVESYGNVPVFPDIEMKLVQSVRRELELLKEIEPGRLMGDLDLTLVPEGFTQSSDAVEEMYDLQQEHLHGNCHALTVLLHTITGWPIKMIISSDHGMPIHSYIDIGGGFGLDAEGVLPDSGITARYAHECSPGSLTLQETDVGVIARLTSFDEMDMQDAWEYWSAVEGLHDLPTILKVSDLDPDFVFEDALNIISKSVRRRNISENMKNTFDEPSI